MKCHKYCKSSSSDDEEDKTDDFFYSKNKVDTFRQTTINPKDTTENSLLYAICYALRFHSSQEKDLCSDDDLKNEIDANLYHKLFENKDYLKLDLDLTNFERSCYLLNEILTKFNYFFRIFELKDKLCYLTNETPTKKNIIRKLSSCVVEKFNGFTIVRVENDRSVRKIFYPIDMIYKPVMK